MAFKQVEDMDEKMIDELRATIDSRLTRAGIRMLRIGAFIAAGNPLDVRLLAFNDFTTGGQLAEELVADVMRWSSPAEMLEACPPSSSKREALHIVRTRGVDILDKYCIAHAEAVKIARKG